MSLSSLLILLLEAHGEGLKRLAAFFGEEAFMEIVETAEDDATSAAEPASHARLSAIARQSERVERIQTLETDQGYREIQASVRELGLPEFLEFYLWAFPPYRALVENAVELGAHLPSENKELSRELVEGVIQGANFWLRSLPIPAASAAAAERAYQVPWLRFRGAALKGMGLSPLQALPR